MAIIQLASNRFNGLSTDTKPTAGVPTGTLFTETDTGGFFIFDGTIYRAATFDHVNQTVGNIHIPYNREFADATARTSATYLAAEEGKFIRQLDTNDIFMLIDFSIPSFVKVSGSGTGEPNTASNQGAGGVGWFITKNGVDLEFKNINTIDGSIKLTDDVVNDEIDIQVPADTVTGGDVSPINITVDGVGIDVTILDGDHLTIDFIPSNYSPDDSIPEANDDKDLSAHLKGIDLKLQSSVDIDNGNKRPARLGTVAALPAFTPLGSGIGKKLQANANGALVLDGIGVVVGDRVFIKNETGGLAIHNGLHDINNAGDGSNKWEMTRAVDYDESSDIVSGHLVSVQEGSENKDKTFILSTDAPIVIESSDLIYVNAFVEGVTAEVIIAASADTTVDSLLLALGHSASWNVDISHPAGTDARETSIVTATEENLATDFKQPTTLKSAVGSVINYTITFTSDGTNMLFKVENNEAEDIVVRIRRFQV